MSRPIPAAWSGFISTPAIALSRWTGTIPALRIPNGRPETRYLPQRALGADGRSHRADLDQHRRVPEIAALRPSRHRARRLSRLCPRPQRRRTRGALCVYASDAEIFDFRPGRYKTEERLGRATANGRAWKKRLRGLTRRVCTGRAVALCWRWRRARACRTGPAAGDGSVPDAGEEAAQIQSGTLGRDGT